MSIDGTKSDLHREYEAASFAHDEAAVRHRAAQRELWEAEEDYQRTWDRVQQAFVALSRARPQPHDEGGLMFGVAVVHGRVVFDFGKPVRSIGFTREGALELAELIKRRAMQCPPIITGKEKTG